MGLGFDLESAVRSANDTVSGTFNVVSKGVRDLPGNLQFATTNVPSGKALLYFGLFLSTGVFFVFIAFTLFLPVMVVMPQSLQFALLLGVDSLLDHSLLSRVLKISLPICHQKKGFHSHWVSSAVWLVPYTYQWCSIATFSPCYSLSYK